MKKVHIKEEGITLVALVITIIILLILAGISISSLAGNGIFEKAKLAKEKNEIADIKERIQLDIFEKQSENKGDITKDQLREILEKYFNNVPETITDETFSLELIAKEQYGGYKIKISDIYDGNLSEENKKVYKLAKDVLKIDEDAEENAKKSPYVMYNGMVCRVLYDATSEYGLQIITNNNVGKVKIGAIDETVSASEFNYTGTVEINDDFKKAAASYNKIVDTLNNKSKTYMDKKGIATNARCIGSSPSFAEDTTEKYYNNNTTTHLFMESDGWNGLFKVGDDNYEIDVAQIKKLRIWEEGNANLRLASRIVVDSYNDIVGFGVRTLVNNGEVSYFGICHVNGSKVVSNQSLEEEKLRHIFLLSDDAKIIDGEGTIEKPYILDI